MSRAADGIAALHRGLVEDVLDAEGGERLVGVGGRRQVVQRASPPALRRVALAHFFGCHRRSEGGVGVVCLFLFFSSVAWTKKERGGRKKKYPELRQNQQKKRGHITVRSCEGKQKCGRREGGKEAKGERKSFSKMGCC